MFFSTGRCKFPVYLAKEKADAWFEMWGITNETRMSRNSRALLGVNYESLSPLPQAFRTIAECHQYRIRASYFRSLEDVPATQDRGDDDIDEEWPVTDPTANLTLPSEIAPSSSGANPEWASASGKRSREVPTTSSVKASHTNAQ